MEDQGFDFGADYRLGAPIGTGGERGAQDLVERTAQEADITGTGPADDKARSGHGRYGRVHDGRVAHRPPEILVRPIRHTTPSLWKQSSRVASCAPFSWSSSWP